MTTKEGQGFPHLNGPFSRDGIYPWQTYYGDGVSKDVAILGKFGELEIQLFWKGDRLSRAQVSL